MRLHAHIQLGAGRLDDAETKSSDHIDNPQIPLAPICAIRQLPCSCRSTTYVCSPQARYPPVSRSLTCLPHGQPATSVKPMPMKR